MVIILVFIVALVLIFGFPLLFGPPYLPTLTKQVNKSIEILDLKPNQVLFELGSGDGRLLIAAAKRGIHCVGAEINPLLVIYSKIICRKYKGLITILWKDYWKLSLASADAIYVFGLARVMSKLDKKIIQEITHPVTVVSFAFRFPDREPDSVVDGLMIYKFRPKANK